MAAPFKPKDAELFSVISAFDAAYSAYNGYQASMERFWTLQYLRQQGITELEATVFKSFPGQPPMARADHLPLVLPVLGGGELPRGSQVLLRLGSLDDITLDVSGQFLALRDAGPSPSEAEDEQEDDSASAGPLTIAVNLEDADAPSAEGTVTP